MGAALYNPLLGQMSEIFSFVGIKLTTSSSPETQVPLADGLFVLVVDGTVMLTIVDPILYNCTVLFVLVLVRSLKICMLGFVARILLVFVFAGISAIT